jgi:DNA polymerase IV
MASSDLLASLPPIFILPTHLTSEEQYEIEDKLAELGGQLTYDPKEARIFLGRITQKKRANFDLRARDIWTEELITEVTEPPRKRQKISKSNETHRRSGSEITSDQEPDTKADVTKSSSPGARVERDVEEPPPLDFKHQVMVLKLPWLDECLKQRCLVPFKDYTTYQAKIIAKPEGEKSPQPLPEAQAYIKATLPLIKQTSFLNTNAHVGTTLTTVVNRAKAEASAPSTPSSRTFNNPHARRRFNQSSPPLTHPTKPPKLHRTTTSEFENLDSRSLPESPQWVRDHNMYACLRSTPSQPPNEAFLRQLYKIKESRILILDEIGVRAYSTAIASIAAYPYVLQSQGEVSRLPGCENKITALWYEWHDSAFVDDERTIEVVQQLDADEDLKHLRLFFEIWGVGAETARKFYFNNGWKDIDDVVEYGWGTLNRVQQIGVKFYDEFQIKIPRSEVKGISDTILRHARLCRDIPEGKWGTDEDIVIVIVGGYRRGKELCGDVDVIVSHRDEAVTRDLVVDVVGSLETESWITHTLTLNTTSSDRGQQTLPYRGEAKGSGFDTLDKALCVWQDPEFDADAHEKNPNIHRRVDIIVSPWRTVGCAVLGWSGATTFERDIRRWCKREKGWKFDSSGVRDRATGLVVDLESPRKEGDGDSWLDRERRLMEGLGIGWREPTERCTG